MPPSRSAPPWEANPDRLVSWWDMEIFSASHFYKIARALEAVSSQGITPQEYTRIGFTGPLGESLQKLGLTLALAQVKRVGDFICSVDTSDQSPGAKTRAKEQLPHLRDLIRGLQERIQDEMAERLFLYVPSNESELYTNSDSFISVAVSIKWANLTEDISEAAKCFALSRYTASVFHLMRVMEFGVQKLGDKLGVVLTDKKAWHVILEEVNKAIKARDQKTQEAKDLASVCANLYNVKLAWRNEVMHPKATYTKEEARRVLDSVKAFIEELATIV